MSRVRVINARNGRIVGDAVDIADTWWRRLRGLLGTSTLAPGAGVWLRPCRAVHMFGMKYPLDVAFVDAGGRVVATYARLAPGRRTRLHRAAEAALEVGAGALEAADVREGDLLEVIR